MIDRNSSLEDVCFAVSAVLGKHGIESVLTGGSAAAIYAPALNTSMDADFVLDEKPTRTALARALAELGFIPSASAGMFAHAGSEFTIDFPAGPLAAGGDYVHETTTLLRGDLRLRILTPIDCVRDRLAHFFHWNDYHALAAAVAVARAHCCDANHVRALETWIERESSPGNNFSKKFEEFKRRLQKAV